MTRLYTIHLSLPAVDKMNQMLGSYGPRKEEHTHLTPLEDAPSGQQLRRGATRGYGLSQKYRLSQYR